jgi:transposase
LPPYSPDLNPIESIWLTMKARWFNNYVCKNEEKLLERLDQAILDVINSPEKTQKTTYIGRYFDKRSSSTDNQPPAISLF